MKIKISKDDVIWNYIGIIVSLAGNFVLIPVLLKFLSTDYYGLWNVFTSLGAISVLFDFGFNSLFARNIAYSWSGVDHLSKENVVTTKQDSEVNFHLLKKVIKTCQTIYLIISLAAFIVLITVGSVYVLHVSKKINNNFEVLTSWLVYALGVFLDLLYGYYDAFLRGIGEIGTDNKARVISKAVQIILTIILLAIGCGILSTALTNVIYGLVFRGICKRKFYEYNGMREQLKKAGKVEITDIRSTFAIVWHNAWREGVVSIANYISNQVTTLLCSLYLGLTATAKFGLSVQFTSAVAQISTALFLSYQPEMQEAYAHRNLSKMKDCFALGIISYIILFPLGLVGITIFIPAINMIKGNDMLTLPVIMGVGMYQFILKYRDCYAYYLSSTNRVFYYKSFIVSSLLCTILSILLVGHFRMGISGFIISQIVSQLVFNCWYWPRYVNRELKFTFTDKVLRFSKQVKRTLKSF